MAKNSEPGRAASPMARFNLAGCGAAVRIDILFTGQAGVRFARPVAGP